MPRRQSPRFLGQRMLWLALPGLLGFGVVPRAWATTLTVTDCGDSTPGGASGQLRRLINDAVAGDVILVPACTIDLTGTWGEDANAGGDLDIARDLVIQGAGPTTVINGLSGDRVFHVQAGVVVTLADLVARHGNYFGDGGGILNLGELHLLSVIVIENVGMSGGGIRNEGTLTLADCVLSGNSAALGAGGGISNTGSVSVADSIIVQNQATQGGGGISNQNGLIVTDSTIADNAGGQGVGGGVANQTGTAVITGSTISGNTVLYGGGGIMNTATLTLVNSTVSGNDTSFSGASGGGLYNSLAAVATLTNVTLTGNTVVNGTGPGIRNEASLTLGGTIVARNGCSGPITSAGHNLDEGTTCGLSGTGDLSGVGDARLADLADNGGPTLTHALFFDSPARDAGGASCLPTDQRGVGRPQGAACDIGAFEWMDLIFEDGFE